MSVDNKNLEREIMVKYKNLKELAEAFKSEKLEGWVLMLDNDSTHLQWHGGCPEGLEPDTDQGDDFENQKYVEGQQLYNGSGDVYILDQALDIAGIPNMSV